jgi:FkbM family methyltransferase
MPFLVQDSGNNIICFNGVATLEPGFYELNAAEGCPEYSSLGKIVHPHAPIQMKKITVRGEILDNLVTLNKLNPILLKIDVEGAEGLVLSGATMVLEKYRPYILSELDDRLLKELKWDARKVLNLLEKYYYDVFDANNGSALSSTEIDRTYVGEIVALPREAET